MLLGYLFDCASAVQILTGREEVDDSGPLEDFAKKHEVNFELLNFQECILGISVPDTLSIKEFSTLRKKHKERLQKLFRALVEVKLEPGDMTLIAYPQWSRHGEPLTYGDHL